MNEPTQRDLRNAECEIDRLKKSFEQMLVEKDAEIGLLKAEIERLKADIATWKGAPRPSRCFRTSTIRAGYGYHGVRKARMASWATRG